MMSFVIAVFAALSIVQSLKQYGIPSRSILPVNKQYKGLKCTTTSIPLAYTDDATSTVILEINTDTTISNNIANPNTNTGSNIVSTNIFAPDNTNNTILLSNKSCKTKIGIFDIIAEEIDIANDEIINMTPTNSTTIHLISVGNGWGNGAHPTTKLCLNFLIKNVKKGYNVLDYGTGSGILSIAAAKLGRQIESCY